MPQLDVIPTPKAPKAVGPYTQCIAAGQFVFMSGQLGLAPETGTLAGVDVASQARQALENIRNILAAAGADITSIVSVDVFLVDLGEFKAFNEVYAEFMGSHKPCRTTVQVAGLPLGGVVEVRALAVR